MKKIFFLPLLLLPVLIISFKPVKEKYKVEGRSGSNHTPKSLIILNKNFPPSQHLPATPKFNAVLFEEAVNKKMKNLVKGYAFAIGDKDGIKARSEGGWAQDPADGNLRMTTRIPSCIGSVSKMISSVALLNLLEAMPQVKLDDPIFSKLPKKWQQKYAGTQVECITYRQLLQHRSGFSLKSGDIANLDEMAKKPKSCPFVASRFYSNANISLVRYLITRLAYPEEVPAIEKKLADLPFDEYTEQANIDYSFPYERYIKKAILDKGLVPITASCRPEPDFMPKVAKEYSDRNDTKGALTNTAAEHIAKGNHCAPQGSWYLSAEMLVHFGRTLLFSNNYLTNTTKNLMFNEDKSDDRLGWASFESHEAFGKETGQTKWPWHNGGQDGYFALLMQLPNGFVGAVLINSYLDNNKGPYNLMVDVLMDAFYEATHSTPVAEIAKHGIAESSYQEEFSMIWNSGYYPVWVDAYDVSGKNLFQHRLQTQYKQL